MVQGPCLVSLRQFKGTGTCSMVSPPPEQALGPPNTLSTPRRPPPERGAGGTEWPGSAGAWPGVDGLDVWLRGLSQPGSLWVGSWRESGPRMGPGRVHSLLVQHEPACFLERRVQAGDAGPSSGAGSAAASGPSGSAFAQPRCFPFSLMRTSLMQSVRCVGPLSVRQGAGLPRAVAGTSSLLLLRPRGSGPAGDACARPAPRLLPWLCQPISANSARSPSSHCFPKLPWPLVRHVLLPQDSKLEGGPGFERARFSDLPCQLTLPSTPLCVSTPGTVNSTLGHFCAHIGHFNQNCACPRSKESESCTRGSMRSR